MGVRRLDGVEDIHAYVDKIQGRREGATPVAHGLSSARLALSHPGQAGLDKIASGSTGLMVTDARP